MNDSGETYLLIGTILFLPALAVFLYVVIARARFTRMRHRKRRH